MSNTSIIDTSSSSIVVTLNMIQLGVGRYLYPIIFSLGNIGSILNILILTQRAYLQSSCTCYILASSIMNLFIVNIVVLFHMLAFGFNIDPTTTSLFFCRFRQYISHVTTLLSRIYIVLACIDRWAMTSTSVRRRAFSRVKIAKILIPSVGIGWCIISLHIPFNHYIVKVRNGIIIDVYMFFAFAMSVPVFDRVLKKYNCSENIGRCMAVLNVYSMFYNIYNIVLSGFLTPILMIIFGFLTVRNVKLSRQRVNAVVHVNRILANQQTHRVHRKSRDFEILVMILVQLCVYLITCLPFPMYLIYSSISDRWSKSNVQLALSTFLPTIVYASANINFCATFYIYVLTARVFRKDLKRLFVENGIIKACIRFQQGPSIVRIGNGIAQPMTVMAVR